MNILSWLFKRKKSDEMLAFYPDAVLVVSMSGEILAANDRLLELFSIREDSLFEMELLDLFDGGFNLVSNLAKSEDSAIVRSKYNTQDEMFLEIKASDYGDDEGKLILAIRDVTTSQKMLNKLLFEHEYLNKLTRNKNSFLTKISGELTSPIHSINGFSQAILEGLGGEVSQKQEKYLKIINKNSTQLMELVNSLVEYTKIESGIWDYEFKNFDLVNMLTNLFNTYKPLADEKKLVLNFDLNSLGRRSIYSDETVLKRILETLIQNAISNTESGAVQLLVSHPENEFLELAGFTNVANAPEKSYLMVKVNDTGAGLNEADLENIFDPYANIEKYIAKKNVNKSLELGITYNLARIIKGKMWVESESLKGSSFAFIIPVERVTI